MEVFEHTPPSPSLQRALKSALPNSINLVYRTQHSNRTEHAHILATFSPTADAPPTCWAAAYLDRSMRPETELWMFAAGEIADHASSISAKFCRQCSKAILSLLDYMSSLPTPPIRADNQSALDLAYQHEKEYPLPGLDGEYPPSPGTYVRHLLMPKVILIGACHEQIVQVMREAGLVRPDMPGAHLELNKFLFKLSDVPVTRELPQGLRWGKMRERDIDTVKARTNIPRSAKTLLSLESVGIFDENNERPVAWTFLGLDGSLTTLHTEPEQRGKGMAKAVATRMMREYAPGLAVDDNGYAWSHADVYVGNLQSEGVCKSLRGKALWKDYWARIDLEVAGTLARSM